MPTTKIKGLLLDIGGVMMTNGWDRTLRQQVVEHYDLEKKEFDERHSLFADLLEIGKLSFKEYLNYVVFYKKRKFTFEEVFDYIKKSVQPFPEVLDYFRQIKKHHGLKIGLVSNESRELAEDRFQKIPIHDFVDFFLVSGFAGMRKPDPALYRLALDLIQFSANQLVYIDDRKPYVEYAIEFGLPAIHHTSLEETRQKLQSLGIGG